MSKANIIVVGAGQAGSHAAMALRSVGHSGAITLIGDEPDAPYERPPLSKEMLTNVDLPVPAPFHAPGRYAEKAIELICGRRAEALDAGRRLLSLDDGRTLPYDKLLFATGSRARRLDVPGEERILYLRTLDDSRRLRDRLQPGARVICIGAGVIGLEIASSAIARGCSVTVVEAGPRVMARSVGAEVGEWLRARHEACGVNFIFDMAVTAIGPDGVATADGSVEPADLVVAGIGIERNTALAAASGVVADNGILVDEFGQTNIPGIYAAGEVAAFRSQRYGQHLRLENWQHAQDHGISVGRSMAGQQDPYDPVPWFWTDQHGINLQIAGIADDAASVVVRGTPADRSFSVWTLDAEGAVIGVTGIDAPRDVRAGRALIRSRRHVDPALIADSSCPVQMLVNTAA